MPTLLSTLDGTNNPTIMSDTVATRMGLKRYVVGVPGSSVAGARTAVFANGVSLTYTATSDNAAVLQTSSNPSFAVLIPYQLKDGTWRLKGEGYAEYNIATSGGVRFFFTGITFTSYSTVDAGGFLAGWGKNYGYTDPGSNGTIISQNGNSAGSLNWSFDAALASKPTWAY